MISDRSEVTAMIRAAKVAKGLKWADVAADVGLSKEWVTAGCLGQMTFTKSHAETIGRIFDLLIYRWYELVNVYGTTLKELIHEEFGDGIMSAIDFSMDLTREPHPNGDRVQVVMSGKFLPYKAY